ncbi:hypothetical protein C8R44DRAFT_786414 [Mycena epipterygia]|nr:hypothetical protein C8R44DRAFT_786414 [Mycena epipterygia]
MVGTWKRRHSRTPGLGVIHSFEFGHWPWLRMPHTTPKYQQENLFLLLYFFPCLLQPLTSLGYSSKCDGLLLYLAILITFCLVFT